MGKGIVLFVALLLSGFAVNNLMVQHAHAAAGHDKTDFAKHFEDSTLLFTEKKMFGVELVIPNERLSTGINEIDLIVHDIEHRDIEDATVTVTPWMPEMGQIGRAHV